MNFLKSFLILFSVALCTPKFFAQEKLPLIPYPQKVEMKEVFLNFQIQLMFNQEKSCQMSLIFIKRY